MKNFGCLNNQELKPTVGEGKQMDTAVDEVEVEAEAEVEVAVAVAVGLGVVAVAVGPKEQRSYYKAHALG